MNETAAYRRIHGSCHCGNIRITLDWPGNPETIPVRACGCSMCRKHRAVWTSNPDGRFTCDIEDESKVSRYRFGTKTADLHTCKNCGVAPIVICEMDGRQYAVVNANTFDDVDPAELVEAATDFDGEDTDMRLARRRRNWTPQG